MMRNEILCQKQNYYNSKSKHEFEIRSYSRKQKSNISRAIRIIQPGIIALSDLKEPDCVIKKKFHSIRKVEKDF